MECCVAVWICSDLLKSKIFSAGWSQRYCRRSVVYAIRYQSDFRCIRVLNSALVGCARCTLGFRFPKKYAHQNDPLNQGNLRELKLRLKIVRYPGIEVVLGPHKEIRSPIFLCGPSLRQCCLDDQILPRSIVFLQQPSIRKVSLQSENPRFLRCRFCYAI